MSDFAERASGLAVAAFAFPGPLRDQLNAAILSGLKSSTTALLADYEESGDELPQVGRRYQLIDSAEHPIAILEATDVRIARLGDVDLRHALDEGEGLTSIEQWREVHERFWTSPDYAATVAAAPELTDDTQVVLERFRLVEVRSD